MRIMTELLIEARREAWLSVAEQELIAFERRERELRKQERLEQAKLKFPALIEELQS